MKKMIKKINVFILSTILLTPSVFAESDPMTSINNLTEFMFSLTTGLGTIITIYGISQFGISVTSHDSSQRINGALYVIGGIIVACARPILKFITG